MRCSNILGIESRVFSALLFAGALLLPPAGGATESSSDQATTQTQASDAEPAPESGEGGQKKEGQSEEEPDC